MGINRRHPRDGCAIMRAAWSVARVDLCGLCAQMPSEPLLQCRVAMYCSQVQCVLSRPCADAAGAFAAEPAGGCSEHGLQGEQHRSAHLACVSARAFAKCTKCVCCTAQVRNMSRQHFQALDEKNKDKSEGLKDAFGKSSKSFYR